MMTDPIADMLTRIRNAVRIERTILDMPASHMRRGIAQVLKDEGYIWDFEEIETVPAKTLRLHMKYGPNGERLINQIDRVSKPGRRVYKGYRDFKPILGGMGIQILSTPRGVISDRRARTEKVGGEVLALDSLSLAQAAPAGCVAAAACSRDSRPRFTRAEDDRTHVADWTQAGSRAADRESRDRRFDDPGRRPQGKAQLHVPARDRRRIRPGRRPDRRQPARRRADQPVAARADPQPGGQHGPGGHDRLHQEARDRRRRLPGPAQEGQHGRASGGLRQPGRAGGPAGRDRGGARSDPHHASAVPDKQAVGQFAAVVRKVRPPEPYKGKGIRYEGEFVRRKAGKAFGSK